jgi:ABC-type Na+ efflux pump permease subunit
LIISDVMPRMPVRSTSGGLDAEIFTAGGVLEQRANTVEWITLFWPLLYAQILLLGGLAVVDVMSRDRLSNVKLLLDVTPLRRSTYLVGKSICAWLALLLSLTVIMLVAGLLGWWAIGRTKSTHTSISIWLVLCRWLSCAPACTC